MALAVILSIATLVFSDYERFALMQLRDKRLTSSGTYRKKFARLQGFASVLVVAAMLVICIIYQFIPHSD